MTDIIKLPKPIPYPYETLDWFDGPVEIKMHKLYNNLVVVGVCVERFRRRESTDLFYGACVTPAIWESYWIEKDISLHDLFKKAKKYVLFNPDKKDFAYKMVKLNKEYMPRK